MYNKFEKKVCDFFPEKVNFKIFLDGEKRNRHAIFYTQINDDTDIRTVKEF